MQRPTDSRDNHVIVSLALWYDDWLRTDRSHNNALAASAPAAGDDGAGDDDEDYDSSQDYDMGASHMQRTSGVRRHCVAPRA